MSECLSKSQVEQITELLQQNSRQNGDCIEWQGAPGRRGYGEIKFQGRRWAVHRLSYAVHVAQFPDHLHIIHLCDNRTCINPDHLAAATHNANMADMKMKGRALHGSKHPAAKLKPEHIQKIVDAANSGMRHLEIASNFGVSRSTITKVVNGTAYRREGRPDER